jgi:hypothetical protein
VIRSTGHIEEQFRNSHQDFSDANRIAFQSAVKVDGAIDPLAFPDPAERRCALVRQGVRRVEGFGSKPRFRLPDVPSGPYRTR